jgi:hypothetical protein
MTDSAVDPGKLDIARVIQQTFAVLGRNLVTFVVLGLVLRALPTGIVLMFTMGMMRTQVEAFKSGNITFTPGYFQAVSMGGLAALITTAILQGALIYVTVQDLSGRPASIGASLATGLRNFLPLLGVTILFALAIAFSAILLIFPAIMLACAWCVALPALVADRTGVFAAFGRSADLTRGNRWSIFALGVIAVIVSVIVGAIVNAITGVSMMGGGNPAVAMEHAMSPLSIGLQVIVSTVGSVVGAAAVAVIYVELRQIREGAGPEWLSDIFS